MPPQSELQSEQPWFIGGAASELKSVAHWQTALHYSALRLALVAVNASRKGMKTPISDRYGKPDDVTVVLGLVVPVFE